MPNPASTPAARQKEIFMVALEFADVAERAQFLDTACGGDSALLERIERLLRLEEESRDFLEPPSPAESAPVFPQFLPGQAVGYFGDYILLEEIARGTSGVVFRARQSSLNRIVALKMLRDRPLLTTEADTKRFRAEAEAAASLNHPNIVPIYEVGAHEGQPYFSMRFIEGGTLHLRAGEFRDPRVAVALMAKVARAVQEAHEHGILHRDLKPGNILIDRKGEPHVVDFGLARQMGLAGELTHTGQVIGTPHYMAPEQARGENRGLTAAADVYSLGAIFYELLAGRKPFDGDTMLTLLQQVTGQPPPPLRIGDRELESLVMRCLEKSPADRPGSAAVLADELERWLRGEPLSTSGPGVAARCWKWVRRRPLAIAAAVAACAGAALFLRDIKPASPPPAPANHQPVAPAGDTYAASRRMAEWMRSLPNSTTSAIAILHPDGTEQVVRFNKDEIPPGDWFLSAISMPDDRKRFPPTLITEFADHTRHLTHLRQFVLGNTWLPTSSLSFLANNPDIGQLVITRGVTSDELLSYISGFKKLTSLMVIEDPQEAKFTGRGFEKLASLPELLEVTFDGTLISDETLRPLRACDKLGQLWIGETRVTDACIGTLREMKSLRSLRLAGCPITEAILPGLAEIKTLKRLDIAGHKFRPEAVAAFRNARPDIEVIH